MVAHVVAGLQAVRYVAERPDPTGAVTVGAIARATDRGLSTTSRLCAELARIGLLEHAGGYGAYRLGPRAIRLSGRAAAPFARIVKLELTKAAQQTGETVCLAARAGGSMTVIDAVVSPWTLFAPAEVGERIDDENSAIGQAAALTSRGRGRVCDSTTGMMVEFATPVLNASGECLAVVAARLPHNRLRSGGSRARKAVETARRAIERSIGEREDEPHRDEPADEPVHPVEALEAAARVLWHLAGGADSIARISRATGLRPDRTQRIVESCRQSGLVDAGDDRGGVAVRWGVHGWYRAAAAPTLLGRGGAIVRQTAERVGQSAFLTVLKGMRSVTLVEELQSPGDNLRMTPWLGRPCPIISADGGPTLLMDFAVEDIAPLIPGRVVPSEAEEFLERVGRVASHGVLSKESFEEAGQISISAPVRDSSGTVVAAACIVGASDNLRPRVRELEGEARRLAADVSMLLGHAG